MKKKEIITELEKLKTKLSSLNRLQNQNQGSISEVKEALMHLQKQEANLEATSKKESALLETIKPDFLTKIKNQDIAIQSINLNLDSVKKLQNTITQEFKNLKRKLESFNYKKVVELNREMDYKLSKMEKLNSSIEKNTRKTEDLFMEFKKNYIDFKNFKALSSKLKESFEIYLKEFDSIKEEFNKCIKEKDLLSLKKDIEKLKNKLIKKKGWFF